MIKVGVIRGGISGEYEVSLASGAQVLEHLRSDILGMKFSLDKGINLIFTEIDDLNLMPGTYFLWFRLVFCVNNSSMVWDTIKTPIEIRGDNLLSGLIKTKHTFKCMYKS